MLKAGSLVRYTRPYPKESHLVYQVAAVKQDAEGEWVMLVEEDESAPDAEVLPGVMGGFGGWEDIKEFIEVISESG